MAVNDENIANFEISLPLDTIFFIERCQLKVFRNVAYNKIAVF